MGENLFVVPKALQYSVHDYLGRKASQLLRTLRVLWLHFKGESEMPRNNIHSNLEFIQRTGCLLNVE